MKYIGLILTFALFSCSKDECDVVKEIPIDYSFFIAGHTYGAPGVDNEGVHPPFRNKFDFIKDDESLISHPHLGALQQERMLATPTLLMFFCYSVQSKPS